LEAVIANEESSKPAAVGGLFFTSQQAVCRLLAQNELAEVT
jgi:hypothetical protein